MARTTKPPKKTTKAKVYEIHNFRAKPQPKTPTNETLVEPAPGFKLNAKQEQASILLSGPQRHTMLKGGARASKTFFFVRAMLIRAMRSAGSRHIILRFRLNAVKEAVWLDTLPKVLSLCFPAMQPRIRWNNSDHYITLPNKSEIWIGGLDEADRVEKVLGKEYATIFFNECSQIPWSSVRVALTRLAQKCDGIVNRAYYDLNPTTTGHWTNKLFILKRSPDTNLPLPDPEDYASMTINPGDNVENIDPALLASLQNLPTMSRKRFFEGEYVSEIPGQLWTLDRIEKSRVSQSDVPAMKRIVIGLDPSGAKDSLDLTADEIGIVACGLGVNNKYYILEDLTGLYSPEGWGRVSVGAYKRLGAECIVGEKNYGGDMVGAVIRNVDRNVNYRLITASRGKELRAEPIAGLFEREMVYIVGNMPTMEEQMTNMLTAPKGYVGEGSPNNLDAMVHAMTELSGHDLSYGLTEIWTAQLNGELPIVLMPTIEEREQEEAMKKIKTSSLIKPVLPDNAAGCPNCGATCIVKIGKTMHCNNCSNDWGNPTVLQKPENRKDLFKEEQQSVRGRLGY